MRQSVYSERPLIRRSFFFDYFPQYPGWFLSTGHVAAKRRFLAKLRSSYKFEDVPRCPLCASEKAKLLANQERHGLPFSALICMNCGLLRSSPRLDARSMTDHYKTDAQALKRGDGVQVSSMLFELQREKGRRIVRFIKNAESYGKVPMGKIRTVAEVGCGEGGAVDEFEKAFECAWGFELNHSAIDYGLQKGLRLYGTELAAGVEGRPDLIVYEQVLEHIHDIHRELSTISKLQQSGDLIYVGVPGLLNIRAAYGSNLLAYFEYQHMHHFTLSTLERLMAQHHYKLCCGDETICALFERVPDGEPISATTNPVRPESVVEFLLEMERQYQAKAELDFNCYLKLIARTALQMFGIAV